MSEPTTDWLDDRDAGFHSGCRKRIAELEAENTRLREIAKTRKAALLQWVEWAEKHVDHIPELVETAQQLRAALDNQEASDEC